MPRLNARGSVAMGVGDGPISIDGRWTGDRGGCAQWLTDDRLIFNASISGQWRVAMRDVPGKSVAVLWPHGTNELAAGGGRWAGWQAGVGVFGDVTPNLSAGLSLVGNDGRGAAGPDGSIALMPVRQVGTAPAVYDAQLRRAMSIPGIARDLQLLSSRQAVWRTDDGKILTMNLPATLQVGPAFTPRWIDVPGQTPWILYFSEGIGTVCHPIDSLVGVLVDATSSAFYPDARWIDGRLVVVFSRGAGEQPDDLVVVPDAFALPRVDLRRPIVVPPVTPVDPPKEPETMDLPADVHAIVVQLYQRHLLLARGDDEQRRELALKIAQTVRARKGPLWGWKSNHAGGASPAKDAIARLPDRDFEAPSVRQRLWIWDLFNGSTRKPNPLPLASGPEAESRQFFIPVDPIDHLGTGTVEPPTQQTHAYDGGDNDTGSCDVCGKPKADPVHIEDEVIPPVEPLPDASALTALKAEMGELVSQIVELQSKILILQALQTTMGTRLTLLGQQLNDTGTLRYRIAGSLGRSFGHSHAHNLTIEREP